MRNQDELLSKVRRLGQEASREVSESLRHLRGGNISGTVECQHRAVEKYRQALVAEQDLRRIEARRGLERGGRE